MTSVSKFSISKITQKGLTYLIYSLKVRVLPKMMRLLDLNEDCLEHMFKYLDIESIMATFETCKRFRDVAERVFKKQTYYSCVIDEDGKNLKVAGNIIRKAGPHIKRLDLDFRVAAFGNNEYEFLNLVKISIGEKLRELTIYSEICSIPALGLCLIFGQLEKLTFVEHDSDALNDVLHIDLPALCPNLQVLIIRNCRMIFAPNSRKSFKKLVELEFESFNRYYPTDEFVSFIEQNQQLRKLYIDAFWHPIHDDECLPLIYIDLTHVPDNLKNLEELRIKTLVFDNVVQGIIDMKKLTKLHTLEMAEYWTDVPEVNVALHNMAALTHLKHLWIGNCMVGLPDQQSIINIAVALPSLESFQSDLQWETETMVEFIRRGQNLKTICVFLKKNSIITPKVIEDVASARELAAGWQRQPLTLIFDSRYLSADCVQVILEIGLDKLIESILNSFSGFRRSKHSTISKV